MKGSDANDPREYVTALSGWRRDCVETLRSTALATPEVEEVVKWGHLVYHSNGPAFLIRAEEDRVLLGFWRGQRMLEMEARLKPGGKYEMATIEIRDGELVKPEVARGLMQRAVELNRKLGDPRSDASR